MSSRCRGKIVQCDCLSYSLSSAGINNSAQLVVSFILHRFKTTALQFPSAG